jgi:membrane associated rhomboid family serine protease
MRVAWHRFVAPLTPGVRGLLCVLTLAYIAAVAGTFSHAYNLYPWLALSGPFFWHGRAWTIVTYALLPATLLDFLFNWVMIFVLGSWLERMWSRWQFWLYCGLCSLGAGLLKLLVQSSSPAFMAGTSPVVFGLLAAWGILFTRERILFWFLWDMTIRQAAVVLAVISVLMMLPCAGPIIAGIMLSGGVTGMLLLWLQGKVLQSRTSRIVVSGRMERLEL